MIEHYPNEYDAPLRILRLEGGCGVIAAWSVLKYFHKRVSSARLIQSCHYSSDGVFPIAMAVALHELGLCVSFHTAPDPSIKPIEKRCYKIAESLGLVIKPAMDLDTLIESVDLNHVAVVLYNEDRAAHFSPLLGVKNNKLLMPYAHRGDMGKEEFLERWKDPEICRQCLIVSRK